MRIRHFLIEFIWFLQLIQFLEILYSFFQKTSQFINFWTSHIICYLILNRPTLNFYDFMFCVFVQRCEMMMILLWSCFRPRTVTSRGIYKFHGDGYSRMPQLRFYNSYTFTILLEFKTFRDTGLLFFTADADNVSLIYLFVNFLSKHFRTVMKRSNISVFVSDQFDCGWNPVSGHIIFDVQDWKKTIIVTKHYSS